ncbi:MAG TPA: patatin-like phospholipase family protein [Steroidobacteraceae bacterium]|jgi:NTE family protein|nr:patatin-like phospholipase family protein [Steroidobacteraceae bacterium]
MSSGSPDLENFTGQWQTRIVQREKPHIGLVLTGGGARSAYQVGVLKGVAELLRRGSACPFPIITGTSAGAVSAIALASDAAHFRRAVCAIEHVWREFRVHHVFRADPVSMLKSGLHWVLAFLTGGWLVRPPHSFFDNTPLWDLLRRQLDFDGIPRSLYKHHLESIGICATCYSDADSVTFYASSQEIEPWSRVFRKGARAQLTLDHLMASLSLPFLFRPVLLNGQYFGDGAMRQTSPLSPAIHLGANRLFIIGVNDPMSDVTHVKPAPEEPTFAQMFGFMLDSLFMDQLHADLERISRYNDLNDARPMEFLVMTPSRDVNEIARRHAHELPRSMRALLRILGTNSTAGTLLLSYLLFERGFTREMIALGVADARTRADEIREFLQVHNARRFRAAPARS